MIIDDTSSQGIGALAEAAYVSAVDAGQEGDIRPAFPADPSQWGLPHILLLFIPEGAA